MISPEPTQHLGIDFGVTNLKWAAVEQRDGEWATLDQGQTWSTISPDLTRNDQSKQEHQLGSRLERHQSMY